jgi:hypothetical protein
MLKCIEEFPTYQIDESGNVFNSRGLAIKKQVNVDGYWVVNLYKEGKYYHRRCARMTGLTWMKDSYFEDAVIDHLNMDITDDHVSNLEWVTTAENNARSIKIQPHIHRKPSEYSEALIREVCTYIQEGVNNSQILKDTGITKDTLLHIRCGASWGWVSKDYKLTPSRRGISESTSKWVCYQLKEGKSYKEILEISTCKNLTIHILKSIKSGKTWTKVSKHIF